MTVPGPRAQHHFIVAISLDYRQISVICNILNQQIKKQYVLELCFIFNSLNNLTFTTATLNLQVPPCINIMLTAVSGGEAGDRVYSCTRVVPLSHLV